MIQNSNRPKTQRKKSNSKILKVLKFICVWAVSAFLILLIAALIPSASDSLFIAFFFVPPILALISILKKTQITTSSHTINKQGRKSNQSSNPLNLTVPKTAAIHDQSHSKDSSALKEPLAPVKPTPPSVMKTYRVTGTTYYVDNIMNLALENSDYDMTKREIIECGQTDERIWKYEFFPSEINLVPEPENPEDKNAIKVIVDGEHVGYIKAGSCSHLLKIIKENRILSIDCDMGGGPYKIVTEDYDYEKDKNVYELDKDERNLFVTLHICEASPHKN